MVEKSQTPENPNFDEFDLLRRLLLKEENARLDEHDNSLRTLVEDRDRFDNRVSEALPVAIRQNQDDPSLSGALRPVIEESLRQSIRQNPEPITSVIFPIIGPAIRKAIANAFREFSETINRVIERSLSVQGMKWRLEAWRTGRSFGDVALANSLLYRIEELFLVHRSSGFLLQHVVSSQVSLPDAQVISPMLTAIRDFVNDAFGGGATDDLKAFEVGHRMVWVEQGPYAYLAAVIRGTPPRSWRDTLQEGVELVHKNFGRELERYQGGSLPPDFEKTLENGVGFLDQCLQTEFLPEKKRRFKPVWIIWALLVSGLAWGGWFLFSKEDGVLELDGEAETRSLQVQERAGLFPFALDGNEEEFLELTQDLFNHADSALRLKLEGKILKVHGFAEPSWLIHVRRLSRYFPFEGLDTTQVIPDDRFVRWAKNARLINPDKAEEFNGEMSRILANALPPARRWGLSVELELTGPKALLDALGFIAPEGVIVQHKEDTEAKSLVIDLRFIKR